MSQARVRVEINEREKGRVALVTVDNSRRLNCLSSELILQLTSAFQGLGADRALRVIVLRGEGEKAFIGGADLNELGAFCADSGRLFITRLHGACRAIRECPLPVIARIEGYCLGAGLEIASSCDMRAAADTAQFGMPEVQVGLPSVIEAALLPGLIGWGRAREMLLTGMMYDAAEAAAMGLVQRIAPAAGLDATIETWLEALLHATPQAVRAQKALMNRWQRVSLEEGIYAGIDALAAAYTTGEPQAAIGAFLTRKRTAT